MVLSLLEIGIYMSSFVTRAHPSSALSVTAYVCINIRHMSSDVCLTVYVYLARHLRLASFFFFFTSITLVWLHNAFRPPRYDAQRLASSDVSLTALYLLTVTFVYFHTFHALMAYSFPSKRFLSLTSGIMVI